MSPARALQEPVVLLTGFEPFAGDAVNPSALVAQALQGRRVAGHRIVSAVLPTVFGEAGARLEALLARHRPALVICTGLAGGRAAVSLERVALNVDDARLPDNAGQQPVDLPVRRDGPAAYFTRLPVKALRQALQAQGIAAEVSQTAGTFVCNHVFYVLMHRLAMEPALSGTRGGFVHLPWLPEQGQPALPIEVQVRALRRIIEVALTQTTDLGVSGGATH